MLLLILSHGNPVSANDQDIGSHQYGVCEKAMIGRYTLLNFILICMTAFQQSHRCHGCQQPLQFADFGQVALQIDGTALWIQPQSQIADGNIPR